ncbi:MAG TPA: hypothetical protein VKN82_02555, partial [Desulfohalobiaceae bacterium]|nr:hypothetical protein [Desulfohalobiaceae bacterium]
MPQWIQLLKLSGPIVVLFFSLSLVLGQVSIICADQETRTVTDMAGRKVEIPKKVKRVACLPGPTYELVFMLG